ncbi:hypothetical protein AtNW77_Chr5g0088121 [Arabidopsis thaliana]|uniref:Transmembrane protein n=2 Tax=Arabidopsis thaliana TaxID=3702 RepID=A0A654FYD9_ARATH|nr:uncharacterized protein AT5G05085 [Arabidopsis thaliana]ANM71121.1 transmembrane protein [Arabidopsis thaliana]CAA0400750.1 unnamed protein product [Arabidopsis thaliana]VYS65912.1 unnamed protein product [Arabidopsis thaliana]|eukprot:NP_001332672.1 transmembrane protein [Arabidopsis thaliana]
MIGITAAASSAAGFHSFEEPRFLSRDEPPRLRNVCVAVASILNAVVLAFLLVRLR